MSFRCLSQNHAPNLGINVQRTVHLKSFSNLGTRKNSSHRLWTLPVIQPTPMLSAIHWWVLLHPFPLNTELSTLPFYHSTLSSSLPHLSCECAWAQPCEAQTEALERQDCFHSQRWKDMLARDKGVTNWLSGKHYRSTVSSVIFFPMRTLDFSQPNVPSLTPLQKWSGKRNWSVWEFRIEIDAPWQDGGYTGPTFSVLCS